jgi:DNA-binding transcriptional regulator YiaG
MEARQMRRTEITAAVVSEAERMFDAGAEHATVASHLGLTPYVVGILAHNRHIQPSERTHPSATQRAPNSRYSVDATTIRMIQRMLDLGTLSYPEIARLTGVSKNTVGDVARGNRLPGSTRAPCLQPDERFLREPIRCSVCRGLISVVPCRACRTRRAIAAKKSV